MTDTLSGFPPALVRRLVIKIGSALLVDPAGEVRVDWLRTLVADVAARKAAGPGAATAAQTARPPVRREQAP